MFIQSFSFLFESYQNVCCLELLSVLYHSRKNTSFSPPINLHPTQETRTSHSQPHMDLDTRQKKPLLLFFFLTPKVRDCFNIIHLFFSIYCPLSTFTYLRGRKRGRRRIIGCRNLSLEIEISTTLCVLTAVL